MSEQPPQPTDELLPWPTDAVTIVGQRAEYFDVPNAPSAPIAVVCRRCRADLFVCTHVVALAAVHPDRARRPVKFFCLNCAMRHDTSQVSQWVDCRNPSGARANPSLN